MWLVLEMTDAVAILVKFKLELVVNMNAKVFDGITIVPCIYTHHNYVTFGNLEHL